MQLFRVVKTFFTDFRGMIYVTVKLKLFIKCFFQTMMAAYKCFEQRVPFAIAFWNKCCNPGQRNTTLLNTKVLWMLIGSYPPLRQFLFY